jgi:hypothetical protein
MSDIVLTKRPHARSTIINGRYAHTSASQVTEFRRCPRKWYYKKICKIEEPGTPAQVRGKRVHSAIEAYLARGEFDPIDSPVFVGSDAASPVALDTTGAVAESYAGYVAIAAPYLPLDDAFEVEREVLLETFPGGPTWVGFIDVRYPGRKILDHKTTSDFRYCKTPEELRQDTQMNVYARWEYLQGAKGELEIAHLYLRTKGRPIANYVSALTTREQTEEIWARDMATVREMAELVERLGVTEEKPDEVDPNTESCGMYGGCYFRHRCGIGDFSVKNFVAAGQLTRRTSTETDVKYVETTSTRGSVMTFEERLAEKMKTKPVLPPRPPAADKAPLPTTHRMPEAPAPALSLEERLRKMPTDIVPEDAPDRNALPGPEPEPPVKRREVKKAAAPAPAAPTAPAPAPTSTATPSLDRFEGAPSLADSVGDALPAAENWTMEGEPATSGATSTAWDRQPAPVVAPAAKPARRQMTLYIDCFPIKGGHRASYVLAEEFIAPLMAQVAADHGLPDYRLIPYGGGKAALAQAIRRAIDQVPEALVVGGYAAGASELLECLIPWATHIVRGK